MLKKLMKRLSYLKWSLEQKFRSKDDTIWDDWYLNSNKPFVRMFPKKDESNAE